MLVSRFISFAPEGLKLYAINNTGEKSTPFLAPYNKGAYTIVLSANKQNHWFTFEKQ